jgi:hypothetical protein
MRFHVERSELDQIVKDLRRLEGRTPTAAGVCANAADAIEWLRQEVEQWRNAWEAECLEHQETKKAFEAKP